MADTEDRAGGIVVVKADRLPASRLGRHPDDRGLSAITLHFARSQKYPEGCANNGYTFVAPLDAEGRLDAVSWRDQRERCLVRRFRADEVDRVGHVIHRSGGLKGATWYFTYMDAGHDDEEAGHHLQDHKFVKGEYVSIREDDGEIITLQVAHVGRAAA